MSHPTTDPERWFQIERCDFINEMLKTTKKIYPETNADDCQVFRKKLVENGYNGEVAFYMGQKEPYYRACIGPQSSNENEEELYYSHFDISENRAIVIAACRLFLSEKEDREAVLSGN